MSDRNNFRNQREVRAACYKARLVLQRKTATIGEVRDAALELNKAVRTLQSWINGKNYYNRSRAEDAAFYQEEKKKHDFGKGPLIPLSFK